MTRWRLGCLTTASCSRKRIILLFLVVNHTELHLHVHVCSYTEFYCLRSLYSVQFCRFLFPVTLATLSTSSSLESWIVCFDVHHVVYGINLLINFVALMLTDLHLGFTFTSLHHSPSLFHLLLCHCPFFLQSIHFMLKTHLIDMSLSFLPVAQPRGIWVQVPRRSWKFLKV